MKYLFKSINVTMLLKIHRCLIKLSPSCTIPDYYQSDILTSSLAQNFASANIFSSA